MSSSRTPRSTNPLRLSRRHLGSSPRGAKGRLSFITIGLMALLAGTLSGPGSVFGQENAVARILDQDPSLNNLVDPPGYSPAPLGSLGDVLEAGEGPVPMILIAGAGFGGEVFQPLVDRWGDRYTMYSVTVAGFAGTPAPPSPPEGTSFGEQTWTNGALSALQELLQSTRGERVIVVGHWLVGTQLALRLALENPDRVAAVVLLAGSANRPMGKEPTKSVPLSIRVRVVDENLAVKWFRTVTRETWDDNNFLPGDYARHPVLGLRYWRQAAQPPLHVWVRYLCEFLAQDVGLELDRLKTPTLLLIPDMEGAFVPPAGDYMKAYLDLGWQSVLGSTPALQARTVPGRVILWAEQPEAIDEMVTKFLDSVLAKADAGGGE